MLEKMEVLDRPAGEDPQMHFTLTPRITSGNDVLTVRELSKAFPGQQLFSDINFEIKRGERVAIIGANGTGKTTILKILNGLATTIRSTTFFIWTKPFLRKFPMPILI